jgi:hypothetical protein
MNAKQMLQMGGYPDTDEGRAAFYSEYPDKESFMMKFGGQLSGAPHNGQPTEKEFFSWGQPINGPRGFYEHGGGLSGAPYNGQPTAAEFFAWGQPIVGPQGFYQDGGSNSPLGYGAFPTMENGGTNTQDINSVIDQRKKSFMDYIQENVQNDQAKKQQAEMEQMMLQQYMMQGMMRNGGGLPKAQQMGQFNTEPKRDANGVIITPRQQYITNAAMQAGTLPSYNMINDNDPRSAAGDFSMLNTPSNPFGYGPGFQDMANLPAERKPIDMNNIMMQGNNAPSVLDGTYSFMTKNAVNPTLDNWTPGGSNDVAFQNSPKETAQMAPTAAGDYDVRTGTSSDGNAYEVDDDVEDDVEDDDEKTPGKKRNKLNPYKVLKGIRKATWLASGDERKNAEDAQQKYMDPNYWSISRPGGDKGNYNINESAGSHFRPNATGASVDPWGNANRKGQIDNPYYTAQEGGQLGGEVEMTDEEIMQFLEMGGDLEILD